MPPIGYITDQYPATSHTFIQREVGALRACGVDVRTFSIHRAGADHVHSRADRQEFESTYSLLPVRMRHLLAAHLTAAVRHPRAYAQTAVDAMRLPASGLRGRLWQLFYLAEAILLWWRCRPLGVRHMHAHFTSPAADVAHLFGRFMRRTAVGRGSWSFTAHGADITAADARVLAAKVRDADFVVCVSDYGRSQLMALVEEEHWNRIHVVRCGVDLASYSSGDVRRANGVPSILAVGRLVPLKGHGVLLEAIARLTRVGQPVRATIVGDGPHRAALERRARSLRVADRVSFTGTVGQDEIGGYYERADVFCLPSFIEGIPVVLLEAMASGVPVVASRITGIPELVEDGTSGVLVAPGRSDLLAAALRSLLADTGRRAELAEQARRRVARDYELSGSAERLRALMERHGVLRGAG
jgi:colanic acid/amylovoran biosynthesis glycosyltransferase